MNHNVKNTAEFNSKMLKVEAYLNDVLKEDLKKIHVKIDYLNGELFEYVQLKNFIETIKDSKLDEDCLKTQVDIGCNNFVQGVIDDPKHISLAIGLGYYVELSLEEALKLINQRTAFLNEEHNIYCKQSATVKSHIKMVLLGLQEMQGLK